MMRPVGDSTEILTEMTPGKKMLRLSRRSVMILCAVFLCAAVAIGAAVGASMSTNTDNLDNPHAEALTYNAPSAPSSRPSRGSVGRLPGTLKPYHYTVKLQPFVDGNFTILGYVEVDFEVLEPTTNVTLNIFDIITKNETVKVVPSDDAAGKSLSISSHLYDHGAHTYTAILTETLQKGKKYRLSMAFEGYLNDNLKGFYRSSYTDREGKTRYLAVSQFEPNDAHLAFPCFDEPSLKATFDVHLAREKTKSSISNMPLKDLVPIEGQDGWFWDIFETTVPMSTYLVAFVVSDFSNVLSEANDHVHFRIWAREEAVGQTAYAVETGPAVLTIFEKYFDVPFPLPKQDMIALPDFSAGAMENWGLITYRETLLLLNPVDFAVSNKESIASVIAHELAHQWFGNLVTLKWWNDLWLNEGFATFVSYIGTSHLEPEWRTMESVVIDELQDVMEVDSLESSHPISVEVETADQINELFDGISYSKGASIIRMMFCFLKEENFKKGIHNYLVDKQYSNAEQDDLWQYLTKAVEGKDLLPEGKTVKTVMDSWTLQKGFPVLKVERTEDGYYASVTQNRFLLVKKANSTDHHEYRWWIPLTYTTENDPDFTNISTKRWMADSDKDIVFSTMPTSDKWIIFNLQQYGYYKVNYDDNNWNLLIKQLAKEHTIIHTLNRAQLIDDSLDLARAHELSYDTPLSLISYLKKEEEYFPWSTAMRNLGYVEKMFTRKAGYGNLRMYLLSLLEPLYNLVGFEENQNDPALVHYKRNLALTWACKLGYKDCVDKSVSLFNAWMESGGNISVIPPNHRSNVYCTGIAEGGEVAWNFAWEFYLNTNSANQKTKMISALGCAKEVWILSRYLESAFTEGGEIRKQDASSVFSAVARNDIGRDLAWNFLRDRWDYLYEYFGSFTTLGGLLLDVSAEFNTRQESHQLVLFKEEHEDQLSTVQRALDQALEMTDNNINWMDTNYQTIVDWLQNHPVNKIKSTR